MREVVLVISDESEEGLLGWQER
ncbi:MAG TPA: transcription factor WhiB, partial [Propionibacteriaceae bacterium]|nr:transcription factor WhiB [Propionibacteriaceae bacterium]HBY22505.1 transcription factor WhiB [Propionibacteriaceae bacterium]